MMSHSHRSFALRVIAALSFAASALSVQAQGTLADYQRGQSLRAKSEGLVVNVPGTPEWIDQSDHFWYSRSVKDGTEFVIVDAGAQTKKLAFDHDKLAAAISSASGGHYTGLKLPFAPSRGGRGGAPAATGLTFVNGDRAIEFGLKGFSYKCTLTDYACTKGAALPAARGRRGGAGPEVGPQPNISARMAATQPMDWSISRFRSKVELAEMARRPEPRDARPAARTDPKRHPRTRSAGPSMASGRR